LIGLFKEKKLIKAADRQHHKPNPDPAFLQDFSPTMTETRPEVLIAG
jgi:hypothetical protein